MMLRPPSARTTKPMIRYVIFGKLSEKAKFANFLALVIPSCPSPQQPSYTITADRPRDSCIAIKGARSSTRRSNDRAVAWSEWTE